MCRVNLHHDFRHHTTSASLFRRLGILNIDNYFHNRILFLGWPRRTYAHEPGATAVTDWLGIAFSTD